MKTFNWPQAYKVRNPATVDWLKTIYKQPISEEEFVRQWLELPHHALRTSTKRAANHYRYLKNNYGFFK